MCSPNNPTGAIVTDADFARFMEAVPKQVLVVVDAAYYEFATDEAHMDALKYFDGVRPLVVLRTFSKAYSLAGVRCGYGFAPKPLIQAVSKVREPFNSNSVGQAGALVSLGEAEELKRRMTINSAGKKRLYQCFDELELDYLSSEANFVYVNVPDVEETYEALLRLGIIVRFFPHADALRVGIGDEEGVDATIAAFKALFT